MQKDNKMSAEIAKTYKPQYFKPGQSGNPKGRPKLSPELTLIKSVSKFEVAKIISRFCRMTLVEMEKAIADPTLLVLDLAIAKIFKKSIERCDYEALNFLLDRTIGKIALVELEEDENDEIAKMSTQELLKIIQNLLPQNLQEKPIETITV
jgi:hypothetical protein